jgi:F420-0:gamma-glutamyl ligase
MEPQPNHRKEPVIEVDGITYERLPVRTHLIAFGEDLAGIARRYVVPQSRPGDWMAISEKVVSVCQNNVRHISSVKAGWLAKLIVKGVKKYPNDIGFSLPEKMQLAVETAGRGRMALAIVLGGITRLLGIHGVFWRVAGHRVSEIDGFNPASMYPYDVYAALPPRDPAKVCADLERTTGIPTVIIDGNNINVEVIAQSGGVPVDKKTARLALLDNPMGQDDEMTPFVLVREMR